jgi:hypothetical protein
MSGNLLCGVGKRVKCLIDILSNHLVLDRDYRGEKDIVLRFGFDANVELLNAEGDGAGFLFAWATDYAEAWLNKAFEGDEIELIK